MSESEDLPDQRQLLAGVRALMGMGIKPGVEAILAAHPMLGTRAADDFFTRLADSQPTDDQRIVVELHRTFLRRLAVVGAERALIEWTGPFGTPGDPSHLESAPVFADEILEMGAAGHGRPETPEEVTEFLGWRPALAAHIEEVIAWGDLVRTAPADVHDLVRVIFGPPRLEGVQRRAALCRRALTVLRPETNPHLWAKLQQELGGTLADLEAGKHPDECEEAITALNAALTLYDSETTPMNWAITQHTLAGLYAFRTRGNLEDNVEQALSLLYQAGTIGTQESTPGLWAAIILQLGQTFGLRPTGDPYENFTQAILYANDALEVYSRGEHHLLKSRSLEVLIAAFRDRSMVAGTLQQQADDLEQSITLSRQAMCSMELVGDEAGRRRVGANVAGLYLGRLRGSRTENVEKAIESGERVLDAIDRRSSPGEWADLLRTLGTAYRDRIVGDRTENFERAIGFYQQALKACPPDSDLERWGHISNSLGVTFTDRLRGDHARNVEAAIHHLVGALEAFTPERDPIEWARVQHNLGRAYLARVDGDRSDNLERALDALGAAEQVRDKRASRDDWAASLAELAGAYARRIVGDREDNLDKGIETLVRLLQVYTRESAPGKWAGVLEDLADLYSVRRRGGESENRIAAIQAYRQALSVDCPETAPAQCRRAAERMGDLYGRAGDWRRAATAYRLALRAAERLYSATLFDTSRVVELSRTIALHQRAAYALARSGRMVLAAATLERGRARMLGDSLARSTADLTQIKEQKPEAYQRYQVAVEHLQQAEAMQQASNRISVGGGGVGWESSAREAASEALGELDRALEGIRLLEGYGSFLTSRPLDDLNAGVRPEMPIAYIATMGTGTLTLLAHRPTVQAPVAVDALWNDVFTVEDVVSLLVETEGEKIVGGYALGQVGSRSTLELALANTLPVLGKQIAYPLASSLRALGVAGVVLVPTGLLSLLPLHAASFGQGGHKTSLIDDFDVAYAPSARMLGVAMASLRAAAGRPPVLAGVGNPLPNPQPLRFAAAELDAVAAFFPMDAAHSLFGDNASQSELFGVLPEASYIHFACHGLSDPLEPLNSYLQLSGQGTPLRARPLGSVEDVVQAVYQLDTEPLTLREIVRRKQFSGARLVVLSACQTAVNGASLPDETVGLAAGFLHAGAAGVVCTLWSVDDLSTAMLMARFYEFHLVGDHETSEGPMAPAHALRRAQCWLRDATASQLLEFLSQQPSSSRSITSSAADRWQRAAADGTREFALEDDDMRPYADAPYHWAPFVFVGGS